MKKFCALLFITFVTLSISISVSAQTDAEKLTEWKLLAPEREEFSIEMPVSTRSWGIKTDEVKEWQSRRYLSEADNIRFYVFSDDPKKTAQIEMVRGFINLNSAAGNKTDFGNYEIEKYVFTENQTYYHTVLLVKSQKRLYAFQTVSPVKENPAIEKFFEGLKLKTGSAFASVKQPTEQDTKVKAVPLRSSGLGSGTGTGQGNGSGSGLGNNRTTPETDQNKETRSVMILTKPRANYTEYARFYDISAKVVLRVLFSANGTIGTISVVSGLPFGLTEQAIAAARGITFKPALRNGIPYSVTKPVEYTFTIY